LSREEREVALLKTFLLTPCFSRVVGADRKRKPFETVFLLVIPPITALKRGVNKRFYRTTRSHKAMIRSVELFCPNRVSEYLSRPTFV
jgi:hypothetical protein